MKTVSYLMILTLMALVVISCNKDKFETKPRIEIRSYNSREIRPGETLRINLDFFDKEGDLDSMFATIDRQNRLPVPPDQERTHFLNYPLPEFPEQEDGEIAFQLPYEFLKESLTANDTLVFHFRVTDRAGNSSDSISSQNVVMLLP